MLSLAQATLFLSLATQRVASGSPADKEFVANIASLVGQSRSVEISRALHDLARFTFPNA